MEPFTPTSSECNIFMGIPGKSGDVYIGVGYQDLDYKDDSFLKDKDSIFFECKTGKTTNSEAKDTSDKDVNEPLVKTKDEIKISVTFESTETCKINFYKNGELVADCPWKVKDSNGVSRLYLLIVIKSEGAMLKIKNYYTQPQKPVLKESRVTLGEAYCVSVYDDGIVESNCCCSEIGTKFNKPGQGCGVFKSKMPFSSKLQYFEMKIMSLFKPTEAEKTEPAGEYPCGIGVCHKQNFFSNSFGMEAGSLLYINSGSLLSEGTTQGKKPTFTDGDVIGCGIEKCEEANSLEFLENGELKQQQHVHIYFTKNWNRICEEHLIYRTDGIYPSILLSKYHRVRILNFQSECQRSYNIEKRLLNFQGQDKPEDKDDNVWNGCEFVVVGVGNKEAENKITSLQQQIDLRQGIPTIEDLKKHIGHLEKHIEKLDLQGQNNLSRLCHILENLQRLSENPQRLHFISMDMASPQILGDLEKLISDIQERHRKHNTMTYELSKTVVFNTKRVLGKLQSSKILEATATAFGLKEDISSNLLQSILQYLHDKGLLALLHMDGQPFAVDVQFLAEVIPDILKLQTTSSNTKLSKAIGESSQIWKQTDFKDCLKNICKDKSKLLLSLLREHFGLIRLQCCRWDVTDEMFIFTTRSKVTPPPVSVDNVWRGEKEKRKNAVVMRYAYKFPHIIPDIVLSSIFSSVAKYSRVLVLTSTVIITQMGAVQTTITQHRSKSGKTAIYIESTCYMPDRKEDPVNEQTRVTVQDYTWNVFSLHTDLIDGILATKRLVPLIKKHVPDGMINVSVGCKHNWSDDHEHPHVKSVCSLCNLCCDTGDECEHSGIIGEYLRKCNCNTCTEGCKDCGICQRCAQEFWDIKTSLRPMPVTYLSSKNLLQTSLNQVSYNEAEYIHLGGGSSTLFLKDVNSDTSIQVFPEEAKMIDNKDVDLRHYCHDLRKHKTSKPGVTVKVRLTDPGSVGAETAHTKVTDHTVKAQESRVIYHASTSRELRISQETGLLCYEMSPSYPVGQFIGPKPFSSSFSKFSFEILGLGHREEFGIGIVPKVLYPPNSMAGWRRSSFGFHSDDGKIYQSQGSSVVETGVLGKVGGVMECEVKFEDTRAILYFRYDGKQVHKQRLPQEPPGGYYPCVSMRSIGGVVRLLEKDPWIPDKGAPASNYKPTAFDTAPYGNLYISPSGTLQIRKILDLYCGWLLLHNPSQDKIGYQISGLDFQNDDVLGCLNPGQSIPVYLKTQIEEKDPILKDIGVKWIAMEKAKNYTKEDVMKHFKNKDFESRIYEHSLAVTVQGSVDESKVITKMTEGIQMDGDVCCLQVFVNGTLEESYWLKSGSYRFEIPYPEGEFIVKYPRAPSYHYSDKVARGMYVVLLDPSEKYYTAAVVTEVKGHGAYTVSYLDMDSKYVQLSLTGQDECNFGMEKKDWEKDVNRFRSTLTSMKTLMNTYVPAPTYLLKEGSRIALLAVMPEWKTKALDLFSNCSQVYTRVIVQEQDILDKSKQISQWLTKIAMDRNFVFMPLSMNYTSLEYPDPVTSFTDISVHTVCYHTRQNRKFKLPVHFVDVPGVPTVKELPISTTFGSKHTAWVYISMLRNKLPIPCYSKLIEINTNQYSREEVEDAVIRLINMYASICSIFAAQYGGLSEQRELGKERQNIIISNLSQPDQVIDPEGKLPSNAATGDELYVGKMGITVCRDHFLSFTDNFDDEDFHDLQLGKYSDLIHVLCWERGCFDKLPDNFFHKLPTVQIIFMNGIKINQAFLPEGLSKCKELENLCLENLPVKKLPSDFLSSLPLRLQYVKISKFPVKQIEFHWPISHRLTSLELSDLHIDHVPKGISSLKGLLSLNLSNNPISDLPDEMEALQKLQVLRIDGIPWISLAGKSTSFSLEQFKDWYEGSTNTVLEKDAEELFRQFNKEKNDVLNEKEIADLNLHLLFEIPRLGTKQYSYLDLFPSAWKKLGGEKLKETDKYGGIPPVIFKLPKLAILSLKYQGITKVPAEIGKLQNLKEIKLDNCPLLESVPGSLGVLPNIKDISLVGCPSLSTPPEEVVRNGFNSVKAFLKELDGGKVLCPRTKLMFVGVGGAGKTSLLRALMDINKKRDDGKEPLLTDGIDISDWRVTAKGNNKNEAKTVIFHTWDFAGQTVYYHTHQFFLTNRAVYLLLWNMRMGYEHAGLDFWLNSIMCHAPDAPILIVGTHLDQVSKPDLPESYLKSRYKQIHGFYYVSAVDGNNLEELERDLVSAALEQSYMKQEVPKVWMDLEDRIKLERSKSDYLEWSTITTFAEEIGIYDEKIKLAMQFLGDLGTIQYFDSEVLNKRIVIKPQWIVNVMAKLVSVKNTLIVQNKGRFDHKDLTTVWEGFDEDVCRWLLSMTEEFDLTFRAPAKDGKAPECNIVPCLVPDDDDEPQEQIVADVLKKKNSRVREIQILYRFKYLPTGLFNRAQVRLFQFAKDTRIWKRGSVLHKGNHTILIQQSRGTSDVSIIVQGPRPENTLLNVHEVFESLIDETYHGVTYDLFIPCPECLIEENKRDCCLFEDALIRSAKSKKRVYFLQCRGDFHEIPLVYLHGALPEATSSDFYIRLQQSINSLQEINSNVAKDVAILYSRKDIPKSNDEDATHPVWIKNYLKKEDISCWYDDMQVGGIQYLRTVIKSCKVVVVCISDEFAQDPTCVEAFDYAADLNIPICPAVITESRAWESSKLKFRLGNPQMAMLRNKDKFEKKITVLVNMVQHKLREHEQGAEVSRQCFISYCWKNSKEAASKGTDTRDSSLGQDPREIRKYLEDNGISCWIDESSVGQEDQVSKDIASGILNSKVAILCVSQEYVQSETCMMEARFVMQLGKPFVVAVVGNTSKWMESETGFILQKVERFETVDFVKEMQGGSEKLMNVVQKLIAKTERSDKSESGNFRKSTFSTSESREEDSSLESNSLNFQEEVELIQRKFMRHFAQTAKAKYQYTPRLLVFDFDSSESKSDELKNKKEENTTIIGDAKVSTDVDMVDGSEHNFRANRKKHFSRHESKMDILQKLEPEVDFDWRKEQFCIRVLCEHEGGWHIVKNSLPLKLKSVDEIEKYLEEASPFLIYLYIILRFSSIPLLCLNGKKGEQFQNWIMEKAKNISTKGDKFLEAYSSLVSIITEHPDGEAFMGKLNKCHLPTGKNLWLCGSEDSSHQNGERITKLGIGATGKGITVLYREDILLFEYLQKTIGPGTLEFALGFYNVLWSEGTAKVKVLRQNGAGGKITSSCSVLSMVGSATEVLQDVPVVFEHGQTEKILDVFVKLPQIVADTSLIIRLETTKEQSKSAAARLGQTKKTVVKVKYDGDCGVFNISDKMYSLRLSTGYRLEIPVIRSRGKDGNVEIAWDTLNISETLSDCRPAQGRLKFENGATKQYITIECDKNHTIPYKESFQLEVQIFKEHSYHNHIQIGKSDSAVVEIINDFEQHDRKTKPIKSKPKIINDFGKKEDSKNVQEKEDHKTADRKEDMEKKKRKPPSFKAVATSATIANAATNAVRNNKSSACVLQ